MKTDLDKYIESVYEHTKDIKAPKEFRKSVADRITFLLDEYEDPIDPLFLMTFVIGIMMNLATKEEAVIFLKKFEPDEDMIDCLKYCSQKVKETFGTTESDYWNICVQLILETFKEIKIGG